MKKHPRVAAIIPHHQGLHPVLDYLCRKGFTYPNLTIVTRQDPDGDTRPKDYREIYRRCSANREALRQRVLTDPDVEWVLSLDSDVLPPPDVVERLLKTAEDRRLTKQPYEVVGGWIPLKGKSTLLGLDPKTHKVVKKEQVQRYIAGVITDEKKFMYVFPRNYKTVLSDIAPLGCCLIRREVLERVPFESGCEPGQTLQEYPSGRKMLWGECLAFGIRVRELGERIGLARDVVCQHVDL